MTKTRTLTIATTALLAGLWMQGCGGKVVENQEVIGAGGSGHDASAGGTGGSTAFDGCPGLGCAPNCGDAGIAIDKNGCTTCTCNPGPDGGTAGTAGTTGCGSGTCGALEQCFNGQFCVAKLVPVTGGYSIDATEVTASQYSVWMATNPSTTVLPSQCSSWKTNYNPGSGTGNYPVATVDWCDAYAYCKAVGKRLCGKIGGGATGYSDYANASLSQWFNACSSGGVDAYPYGNTYGAQTCNGSDDGAGATVAVGSLTGCDSSVTGYTGVYDLSGNVVEWEDSCDGNTGQNDYCLGRGG